jgi:hypothetical protein
MEILAYVREHGVAGAPAAVRKYATRLAGGELPRGLADALQSRTLDHANQNAGPDARRLLNGWADATGREAACVVVGHCLQFPPDLVLVAERVRTHARLMARTGAAARYEGLDTPSGKPDRPAINASLDTRGRAAVFRVDVGLSRCWSMVFPQYTVWPQALTVKTLTDATATLVATRPV